MTGVHKGSRFGYVEKEHQMKKRFIAALIECDGVSEVLKEELNLHSTLTIKSVSLMWAVRRLVVESNKNGIYYLSASSIANQMLQEMGCIEIVDLSDQDTRMAIDDMISMKEL